MLFFKLVLCDKSNGYGNFLESILRILIDSYIKKKILICLTILSKEETNHLHKILGQKPILVNSRLLFYVVKTYNNFFKKIHQIIISTISKNKTMNRKLKEIVSKYRINPLNILRYSHKKMTLDRINLRKHIPDDDGLSQYYLEKYNLKKDNFVLIFLRENQQIDEWRFFSHNNISLIINYLLKKNIEVIIVGHKEKLNNRCKYIDEKDILFAPIVLSKYCKYFIHTNSGPEKIKNLTWKPSLGLNISDIIGCYPHRENQSIKTVKYIINKNTKIDTIDYITNSKYFLKKKVKFQKLTNLEIFESFLEFEKIYLNNFNEKEKSDLFKNSLIISNFLNSNKIKNQRIIKKHFNFDVHFGNGIIL